jgi:hypothetical protein
MDFNIPPEINLDKKQSKKDIDFCERLFVEKLGKDFPDHLDMVISTISSKINDTTGFKEKQFSSEVVKKLSISKFSITEQFKNLLKKNIRSQLESKGLAVVKLNWHNLNFSDEETNQVSQSTFKLRDAIKSKSTGELAKLDKYIDFLLGEPNNILSSHIISEALSNTLKGSFSSVPTFCLAMDTFAIVLADKMPIYYREVIQHLEKNNIEKRIKEHEESESKILNAVPNFNNQTNNDSSGKSEASQNKKEEENNSNFIKVPDNFTSDGIDLDAFLKALPPPPKIDKKDDSFLSIAESANINLDELPIAPSFKPTIEDVPSKKEETIAPIAPVAPVNNESNIDNSTINQEAAPAENIQPPSSNTNESNSSSSPISAIPHETLKNIDALAQNGNVQVIVVQGGGLDPRNLGNGGGIGNGTGGGNGTGNNGTGGYIYDAPRDAPIDPEVAREQAVQKIANDINKALLSQQRIEPVDFYSLIKKDFDIPDIQENESKIILLPKFLVTLRDVQNKFLKVNLEIFNKTKIYKKSIFLEILKNKLFSEKVNYYDIFVLRLMANTYEALYENEYISQHQKLALFKTQLWVLQVALVDQSFWYFKDHPARVLFDFIINTEVYNNISLNERFDKVISSIDIPENITIDFFIPLINRLKQEINQDLEKQKELFADKVKPLQKDESLIFAYSKAAEHAMTITSQTDYAPLRQFAEEVWAIKFVQKLSKMTSLTIFDLPDFTKVLPANMKAMLNQHFIIFETLVALANNKDGSKSQMEKLQKFIIKANEGLATLAFDLDIETRLTKALFSFIKYKLDVISKTSNPVMIKESMNKIASNELAFKKEVKSLVGDNALYVQAKKEILEKNYDINALLKINRWYSIDEELLKLLYISPREDFYIFLDMSKNLIRVMNKPQLWELIKKEAVEDFTEEALPLNILNFLVEYNSELANSDQNNGVIDEAESEKQTN